jgi:hypothetical protein
LAPRPSTLKDITADDSSPVLASISTKVIFADAQ